MSGALVFLLASAASAALPVPETALPEDAKREFARLEQSMSRAESGRRLLTMTAQVPRREGEGPVVAYRSGPPRLVFDTRAARRAGEWEFQLAFARELFLAMSALPFATPDERAAARHAELAFALELAREDEPFGRSLWSAFEAQRRWIDAPPPRPAPPRSELGKVARLLALFHREPEDFLREAEAEARDDAVRLSSVEDFAAAHGPRYDEALEGPQYARLKGRRYRRALLEAARQAERHGGVGVLRERLGAYDTVGFASMRRELDAWLRAMRTKRADGEHAKVP